MKNILILSSLLLISVTSFGQYKPVNEGAAVKFTIKNLGFDVTGSFGGLGGSINFDPKNLAEANFDVTITANTVNTDNSLRDEHLKGGDFFDVKNYPQIHITAGKIVAKGSGYLLTGVLTMKGKSKEISFPFTATPSADGYVFKGSFKLNRKDFGVGGTSIVSNELQVDLNIQAKKVDHV